MAKMNRDTTSLGVTAGLVILEHAYPLQQIGRGYVKALKLS